MEYITGDFTRDKSTGGLNLPSNDFTRGYIHQGLIDEGDESTTE